MYILSEKFIGNIRNTKNSCLINDIFFYTNDDVTYNCIKIDKDEIYKGTLTVFFTFIKIHDWINKDILKKIREYIDIDKNVIYLKINIDKYNNITGIHIVKPSIIKNKKIIQPVESIVPVKDNSIIDYISKEGYSLSGHKDILKGSKVAYIANIMIPVLEEKNNIKQYSIKNKVIFNYESKPHMINSVKDLKTLVCA